MRVFLLLLLFSSGFLLVYLIDCVAASAALDAGVDGVMVRELGQDGDVSLS